MNDFHVFTYRVRTSCIYMNNMCINTTLIHLCGLINTNTPDCAVYKSDLIHSYGQQDVVVNESKKKK
jgi:hypothetical protein